MRELYLNNNWLPTASLKEFAQIKSLCILDLAHNKLSADFEKWKVSFSGTGIKNLVAISTKGNVALDQKTSLFKQLLQSLLPSVKYVNPPDLQSIS